MDLYHRLVLRLEAFLRLRDPGFDAEGHTGANPEKVPCLSRQRGLLASATEGMRAMRVEGRGLRAGSRWAPGFGSYAGTLGLVAAGTDGKSIPTVGGGGGKGVGRRGSVSSPAPP